MEESEGAVEGAAVVNLAVTGRAEASVLADVTPCEEMVMIEPAFCGWKQ